MKRPRVLAACVLIASPLVLSTVACDPPRPYVNCGLDRNDPAKRRGGVGHQGAQHHLRDGT